jgi:hypothetical protein
MVDRIPHRHLRRAIYAENRRGSSG